MVAYHKLRIEYQSKEDLLMKFGKKSLTAAAVAAFALISTAAFAAAPAPKKAAPADDGAPVIVVGTEQLGPNEMIEVLQNTAGGNPMMVGLMLTQSSLKDRLEMAKQISETMLFAEGAKLAGLEKREDIAFKLKWQKVQTLTEEYFKEISKKWDMSEKALKKYYEGHKEEFVQAEGTHIRHILSTSEKDSKEALAALVKSGDFAKTAEKYSKDPNSAPNGGDLSWIEKGTMPAELEKAVNGAKKNEVVGPVKTEIGWHIVEVLDRRPQKQLTFEEAKNEIAQRLQMSYLRQDLDDLKKKIKVDINDKKLDNLAGIPSAAPKDEKPAEAPKAK